MNLGLGGQSTQNWGPVEWLEAYCAEFCVCGGPLGNGQHLSNIPCSKGCQSRFDVVGVAVLFVVTLGCQADCLLRAETPISHPRSTVSAIDVLVKGGIDAVLIDIWCVCVCHV